MGTEGLMKVLTGRGAPARDNSPDPLEIAVAMTFG